MPEPAPKAYAPFQALRRPGGSPTFQPAYRILIHKGEVKAYEQMAGRVSEESLQQLWDHLALRPAQPPDVNSVSKLRGRKYGPLPDGTSRVMHYRIGKADRIDYRYHDAYAGGAGGDPHGVVFIIHVYRSRAAT